MLLLQWRYVSQCKPEISLAVTWAETLSFSLTHTCRQIADYLQDLQSKSALLKVTFLFLLDAEQKHKAHNGACVTGYSVRDR